MINIKNLIKLHLYELLLILMSLTIFFLINSKLVYEWGDIVQSLLSGKGYMYLNRPSAYMPPLYPLCLTLFIYLFGSLGVNLLHTILFVFTYIIFVNLLKQLLKFKFYNSIDNRIINKTIYFIPLFFFLYPPVIYGYLNVSIFPLSTLLFLTFIFLLSKIYIEFSIKTLILLGLISGLLTLSRSEFLYIGPFVLFVYVILLKAKFSRNFLLGMLLYFITLLLTISPWLIRNKMTLGQPVLSTAKYYNLWRGNNLDQSTIPINPEEYYTNINFYNNYTELQQEAFLKLEFEKYIISNKKHFFIGIIKKMRNFYFSFYPNSEYHGKYSRYLFIPWMLILGALIFKLINSRRIIFNPFNLILLFIFILYGIIHGLTQVLPRYNLQFLIIFITIFYSNYLCELEIKNNSR